MIQIAYNANLTFCHNSVTVQLRRRLSAEKWGGRKNTGKLRVRDILVAVLCFLSCLLFRISIF